MWALPCQQEPAHRSRGSVAMKKLWSCPCGRCFESCRSRHLSLGLRLVYLHARPAHVVSGLRTQEPEVASSDRLEPTHTCAGDSIAFDARSDHETYPRAGVEEPERITARRKSCHAGGADCSACSHCCCAPTHGWAPWAVASLHITVSRLRRHRLHTIDTSQLRSGRVATPVRDRCDIQKTWRLISGIWFCIIVLT